DDDADFMEWWLSEKPWKEFEDPGAEKDDAESLKKKAENLKKALYVYTYLLRERGTILQGHVKELEKVAKNTDNKVKTANVTGVTVGVLGLAAAVISITFAPLSRGASFTVAALGFGVASFTASIFNNLNMDVDSMKVKMIFEDFTQIEEIEKCLLFISTHVECLKRYDLSTLKGVSWNTEKVVRMAHIFGDCVKVISAVSKCSGLIHGFMMGMETNFGRDDSKQLGAKSRFAMQIRVITKHMEAVLDALMVFQTEVE
ncbi:apolipoprotein L, 1, partial [Silurus asotus]